MPTDAHPDGLRCPSCRSTNVVCHGRPHGHECQDCGYDGTTPDPLAQALALLRSHADVCSRYGESGRLRAEADRIEALAGVAAEPEGTKPRTDVRCGCCRMALTAQGSDWCASCVAAAYDRGVAAEPNKEHGDGR